MTYEITKDNIKLTMNKKDIVVDFQKPVIVNLLNSIKELLTSLKENDFDWKKNNNQLIFNMISKALIFINKYKKLSLEERKDICFKLIEKLIEKEIENLDLDDNSNQLLQSGIDTIIEPIIELALLAALKKIQLRESCLKCLKM